jgi:F0F1-type ATP synthase alpha subunit
METSHPDILETIAKEKALSEETEAKLRQAIQDYNLTWN